MSFLSFGKLTHRRPYLCPLCRGRGVVQRGFYITESYVIPSTSTEPEKCRSCDGRGYVR